MLELKNISFSIGSRVLVSCASMTVFAGDKIGIVGHNGCGKTTLLRAITGEFELDSGEICISKGVKIICVKQEITDNSINLLDFVVSADQELLALREQLNTNEGDLAEIYERINTIGGNSADSRAATILAGLGFKNADLGKSLSCFSGGWQVRAALAASLFAPSDILILDEPTNHLDLESVIWLESFLRTSQKALLLVSHERSFLAGVCNKILNIDSGQVRLYSGNYSSFVRTRLEQQQALTKMFESQQQKREHIQEFIDRFRYKATKARQVQSRIKLLEKMPVIDPTINKYTVNFCFSEPFPVIDRRLVTLENISVGYGDHVVLHDVSLNIDFGEHIAFLGANGNGKSTLAKIIAQKLSPFSGTIKYARNLKIAYFSQQQSEELDFSKTAIEMFHVHYPEQSAEKIRTILAEFGLIQSRALTKIEQLSGGEKTRLLLAIITFQCPHILVLDEPTNHLDIEAREALVLALQKYKGAVIWISHDFHTIKESCRVFYIVHEGTCERFVGNLEDYRAFLLSHREIIAAKNSGKKKVTKKTNKEKLRRIATLESAMQTLSIQRTELEQKVNENYSIELYEQYIASGDQLQSLEAEWLSLMELIESEN